MEAVLIGVGYMAVLIGVMLGAVRLAVRQHDHAMRNLFVAEPETERTFARAMAGGIIGFWKLCLDASA